MKKMYAVENTKSGQLVIGTNKKVKVTDDKSLAEQLVEKMTEAHPDIEYKVVLYKEPKTETAKELAPEKPEPKKATKKTAEPKKEKAPKKTPGKQVLLMTFTGMEIGIYDIVKKTSATVTIETKKGELKFSLKDMKQTNANNPNFANKIKLV